MAFDASRPVPWPKLLKLLAIYLVGVNVVLYLLASDKYDVGVFISTIFGGFIYVALTVLLVKMGVDPFRFGRPRPASQNPQDFAKSPPKQGGTRRSLEESPPARGKPVPTKRTNAGNPKAKRR
jgi:hypothetical protein